MRFNIKFNYHRYIDHSDKPKSGSFSFEANSFNDAENFLYIWRDNLQSQTVTKRYIGMIHWNTLQTVNS